MTKSNNYLFLYHVEVVSSILGLVMVLAFSFDTYDLQQTEIAWAVDLQRLMSQVLILPLCGQCEGGSSKQVFRRFLHSDSIVLKRSKREGFLIDLNSPLLSIKRSVQVTFVYYCYAQFKQTNSLEFELS